MSYTAVQAAQLLGIPYHKILALARANGYGRYQPKVGWRFSPEMIARIKGGTA